MLLEVSEEFKFQPESVGFSVGLRKGLELGQLYSTFVKSPISANLNLLLSHLAERKYLNRLEHFSLKEKKELRNILTALSGFDAFQGEYTIENIMSIFPLAFDTHDELDFEFHFLRYIYKSASSEGLWSKQISEEINKYQNHTLLHKKYSLKYSLYSAKIKSLMSTGQQVLQSNANKVFYDNQLGKIQISEKSVIYNTVMSDLISYFKIKSESNSLVFDISEDSFFQDIGASLNEVYSSIEKLNSILEPQTLIAISGNVVSLGGDWSRVQYGSGDEVEINILKNKNWLNIRNYINTKKPLKGGVRRSVSVIDRLLAETDAFDSVKARNLLQMPKTSAIRVLNRLIKLNKIRKYGFGKATRYLVIR